MVHIRHLQRAPILRPNRPLSAAQVARAASPQVVASRSGRETRTITFDARAPQAVCRRLKVADGASWETRGSVLQLSVRWSDFT